MTKTPSDKNFGKRLASLRKQKGLTLEELGKQAGVTPRVIFYYEKESKHPPTNLLVPLAKALGVSLEELLGVKPSKNDLDPEQANLWRKLKNAQHLPKKDQRVLLELLNVLLEKNRK